MSLLENSLENSLEPSDSQDFQTSIKLSQSSIESSSRTKNRSAKTQMDEIKTVATQNYEIDSADRSIFEARFGFSDYQDSLASNKNDNFSVNWFAPFENLQLSLMEETQHVFTEKEEFEKLDRSL